MKSMKKTLALMLVIVMALGMVQFVNAASPATKFTDDGDIEYPEAVAVLSGIDVIAGYSEDSGGYSFKPTKTLKRSEAAELIAKLLLTPKVWASLPTGTTPFKDVEGTTSEWAAKSIAYCVSQGIIVGTSATTFSPDSEVTGVQIAIMLLRALKIGDPSLYVGPNWAINAVVTGVSAGILSTDVDYSKPAQRQEMAQYVLNGLDYSEKTETKTTTMFLVSAGDSWKSTYIQDGFIGKKFETVSDAQKAAVGAAGETGDTLVLGRHYIVTPVTTVEEIKIGSLAQTLYKMTKETDEDSFGRPGVRTWKINGTVLFSAQVELKFLTYTTAVTEAKVFEDLELSGNTAKYTLRVDGAPASLPQDLSRSDNTSKIGGKDAGNGVLTEVYPATASEPIKIILVSTYVGKVEEVKNGMVSVTTETASGAFPDNLDGSIVADGDYKAGDVVLYTAVTGKGVVDGETTTVSSLKTLKLAEKLTLTPTSFILDATRPSFVADGQTYYYSKHSDQKIISALTAQTIYLDNYGYVIKSSGGNSEDDVNNYFILTGLSAPRDDGWGNMLDARIQLLAVDGTSTILPVPEAKYNDYVTKKLAGKLVVPDGDGGYKLATTKPSAATVVLEKGATSIGSVFAVDGYLQADTVIFVREKDVTGKAKYIYTAYKGSGSLPSGLAVDTADDGGVFYVNGTGGKDVMVMYITSGGPGGGTATVYLTGKGSTVTSATATYYKMEGVVNGEATTLSLRGDKTRFAQTNGIPYQGLYAGILPGDDGLGTPVAYITYVGMSQGVSYGTSYHVVTPPNGKYVKLEPTSGGDADYQTYASTCRVFYFNEAGEYQGVKSITALKADTNDIVYTIPGPSGISSMFVTIVSGP